jgi:hypothetical protein
MPLLDATVHVARETPDVDRLIGFYARVFDADLLFDHEERCRRRVGLRIDRATILQPFEVTCDDAGTDVDGHARTHDADIVLETGSRDAFLEVRQRLVAAGASDGVIRDIGAVYSLSFVDPDGVELRVNLAKHQPEGTDWRTVDDAELLDDARARDEHA